MFYLCITSISRCCWHIVYRSFVHSYVVLVYRNPTQSFYSSPCYSICFKKIRLKEEKKILDSYFYGKKCNEEVNSKQTEKKEGNKKHWDLFIALNRVYNTVHYMYIYVVFDLAYVMLDTVRHIWVSFCFRIIAVRYSSINFRSTVTQLSA